MQQLRRLWAEAERARVDEEGTVLRDRVRGAAALAWLLQPPDGAGSSLRDAAPDDGGGGAAGAGSAARVGKRAGLAQVTE